MTELRIECFHRVLPSEARRTHWPYFARGTAMTVEEFDDRLAYLARHYELIDEVQASKLLDGEASSIRGCWVTFDDGYADVLSHAADVVAKYGIRPSIFITTRVLNGNWWPAVDRWYSVLCQARRKVVQLSLNDVRECWDLETEDGRKRAVVGKLKSAYLEAKPSQQAEVLNMLCDVLDVSHALAQSTPFLNSSELVELSSRGWYVGPHGHEHRLLPMLAQKQLTTEVLDSVNILGSLALRSRSSWFAYSDGRYSQHVCREVSKLLSSRGYCGALTIDSRLASGNDHRWSTPRFIA